MALKLMLHSLKLTLESAVSRLLESLNAGDTMVRTKSNPAPQPIKLCQWSLIVGRLILRSLATMPIAASRQPESLNVGVTTSTVKSLVQWVHPSQQDPRLLMRGQLTNKSASPTITFAELLPMMI
ncbi:hypothetical protein D3C87_1137220 [compost metagenome]